ncbi:TolC family protein [Sphingobium sp. Z007]|uniref:TolC family protein n=1 Tax=Sphingobium sp. Z007 TaxID=627495 RepID=UPI0020CBA014|nr:TolC family protein [Sphingobium sp. Z007]
MVPCVHSQEARAPNAPRTLVQAPNPRPFSAPIASDPLLELAKPAGADPLFRSEIETAIRNNPLLDEARASEREARAARTQARSLLFPSIDLSIDANRSVARNFSNDPGNIIERSRPEGRTDATASVRQRLLDFGAASNRIGAGNARVDAARQGILGYGEEVGLRTITAWYSVFAQRLMAQAAQEYIVRQMQLRGGLQRRIDQGFSAQGDLPRVDSSIANVRSRLAGIRRDLAGAEAQYRALTGHEPPPELARATLPPEAAVDMEVLDAIVLRSPVVRKAEAEARAARQEARAARSDRLPTIAAGVDAGRYGVFESPGDYDVRGRIIVRAQLGAGFNAKADQATARADAADAYADRVRQEAMRDAQMALADIRGLDDQLAAAEASYIANRNTRDVIATRFEASQGTLYDLLYVEDNYFYSIASYVQTLAERDVSRFALLGRTGRLLPSLSIAVNPSDRMETP